MFSLENRKTTEKNRTRKILKAEGIKTEEKKISIKMNFENNKTKKILLTGTTYVMGKRWRRKNIKSKYQCLVRDIFPDKTDSQLKTSDKLLRKLRTND